MTKLTKTFNVSVPHSAKGNARIMLAKTDLCLVKNGYKSMHYIILSKLLRFCLLLCLLLGLAGGGQAASISEITPSHVYAQTVQIEKEVELLRRHYKITARNPVTPVVFDIQSRHAWQKSHGILVKLNILRRKNGMDGFSPVAVEPSTRMEPAKVWEQTQRILTELRILKKQLGVVGEISPAAVVSGKQKIDVFNKLNEISYDLDALNGEGISPSYVYAEALRINEDINAILRSTNTLDSAVPPARNIKVEPKDSLRVAFALMQEIQRLQRKLAIENTDFSVFLKKDAVVPSDVFNMIGLCLAELQLVKAKLGMNHHITPPAEFHRGKTPAEVVQLLGYATQKLHLVNLR